MDTPKQHILETKPHNSNVHKFKFFVIQLPNIKNREKVQFLNGRPKIWATSSENWSDIQIPFKLVNTQQLDSFGPIEYQANPLFRS